MRSCLAAILFTTTLLSASLTAQNTILCVGDSVTFGTGAAREHSYPAELARMLPDSRVINAGWPGRNSRVTLERFGDYIDTFHPTQVVLLVGANDAWSQPKRLQLKVAAKPRPASTTSKTYPFLGDWHAGALDFEIHANGTFVENGTETFWYIRGEDLIVRRGATDTHIQWKVEADSLELKGPWPVTVKLVRGPAPTRSSLRSAWQVQRSLPQSRSSQSEAKTLFESCFDNPIEEGGARLGLIAVGRTTQKRSLVQEQVKWFQKRAKQVVHPTTQRDLLSAYQLANDEKRLVAMACDEMKRDVSQYPPWEILARHGNDARFRKDFKQVLDHALTSLPALNPLRVNLLRARGSLQRFDNRDASLRDLMASILLDHHDSHLVLEIRRTKGIYNRKMFERQLSQMEVDAEQEAQLRKTFDKALKKPSARPSPILTSHIEQIAKLCKSNGIPLLLLTYPYHAPEIDSITTSLVRQRLGTKVDIYRQFKKLQAELGSKSYHKYFVLDGHPNELGYKEIAKLVAARSNR